MTQLFAVLDWWEQHLLMGIFLTLYSGCALIGAVGLTLVAVHQL